MSNNLHWENKEVTGPTPGIPAAPLVGCPVNTRDWLNKMFLR